MQTMSEPTVYCEAQNINYGETCSRKAKWVYDSPRNDGPIHYCTQHAPKRNRYCKPLDESARHV